MNIVIGGIQGSGKGTQSKVLASRYNLRHISVGDCIYHYLVNEPEFVLPYTLEKYRAGELAPNDVVNRVTDRELRAGLDIGGFVLDGFPRQHEQLDFLMSHIAKIDLFLFLEMSEDACVDRLMSRGRADDTVEGIRRRVDQYTRLTYPVLEALENLVPTHRIDASKPIDEVSEIIDSIVRYEFELIG